MRGRHSLLRIHTMAIFLRLHHVRFEERVHCIRNAGEII
jgi:hypothetical protein